MTELRFAPWWRLAGVMIALAVLVLAIMPVGGVQAWRYADKLGHVAAFAILTLWFAGAYPVQRYPHVAIVLLLFGAGIELIQSSLGHRSAEWADWAADAIGIVIGLMLALAGLRHWCGWFERRVFGVAVP